MAKIGLNNFRYSKLTESETGGATYEGAKKPAKAVSCKVSISTSSASLYADDVLAESDTSFNNGTVTIGIDEEDNATMADLLGHTIEPEGGEMVRNANDVAPYVGLGRVVVKMVNGVRKYKVEFLCKVKFSEPSQDDKTKGENVEFTTSELEGTVSALADGTWSKTKTFDTQAEAITYLEGLMAKPGTVSGK
jgi:phi13 family phage major tail protein